MHSSVPNAGLSRRPEGAWVSSSWFSPRYARGEPRLLSIGQSRRNENKPVISPAGWKGLLCFVYKFKYNSRYLHCQSKRK